MNQDDNIKRFFEKRLKDEPVSEEGWNVPSDDIWNKAKVNFPKKKKRRIPFFFILFGLIGMGVMAFYGYPYFNPQELEQVAENKMENVRNAPIDVKGSEVESEINNKINSQASGDTKIEEQKPEISHVVNTRNANPGMAKNWVDRKSVKKQIDSQSNSNSQEQYDRVQTSDREQYKVSPGIAVAFNILEDIEHRRELVDVEYDLKEPPTFELLPLEKTLKWNRWEIGMTYAPFIISPRVLVHLEDDDDPDLTQSIDWKYRNFNIPISRRLGTRFSLTSGLSWSSIDIGLNIRQKEIYQMGSTDETLRNLIDENSVGGSITLDKGSSDITFKFSEDADLQNGDEIEVRASLPLSLEVVQIPILLNFHIPRGKFEWLLHAGFSLDFFEASVTSVDFAVYKNSNLISESVGFEPLAESAIGLSLYAGAGLKYHINNRINLGVNTKIDLGIIPLARYEVGIFYKF